MLTIIFVTPLRGVMPLVASAAQGRTVATATVTHAPASRKKALGTDPRKGTPATKA